ncbi:MAG: tryptophan synthase subunit alpha [SAR324 cluster bacterium]|uniref:Tryptophan synthase alpha chain n=1 Tax=SAR324 cluster bacterium TaxID=2024889 RepID=A0A2A4TA98_9DELT|nr:MAG: tryptophan synthase subunit alpha [SAR324 cluster bacterium]
MLEQTIRKHQEDKKLLLMTHLVLGYPSFDVNRAMIKAMAAAGVELIELQIPFSEPMADGPTIMQACCDSLDSGTKVSECIAFAEEVCAEFPQIQFLFMTYLNIPYVYGLKAFVEKSKAIGIQGFIIPDLPLEESEQWLELCQEHQLSNIFIFTPTNSIERLQQLASVADGFVYCVGRRGVTGKKTDFDQELAEQIALYRKHTKLPIALGFGVQGKEDIEFLAGKADIAVIGSKLIQLQEEVGAEGVERFLKEIRADL